MPQGPHVYAIATMDSKGHELAFVARTLRDAGAQVVTVDVGTLGEPAVTPEVSRGEVAACHPGGAEGVLRHADRGKAVTAMGEALIEFLRREHAAGARIARLRVSRLPRHRHRRAGDGKARAEQPDRWRARHHHHRSRR